MYIRDVSAPAGSHSQRGISISRERERERARASCREQFVALNYFEPVPLAIEVIGHFEEGYRGSIKVVPMLNRASLSTSYLATIVKWFVSIIVFQRNSSQR